jgi:hypothetical protein
MNTICLRRHAAILIFVAACGTESAVELRQLDMSAAAPSALREGAPTVAGLQARAVAPERIIRTAQLHLEVDDVTAATVRIDSIVRQADGIVADRRQSAGENSKQSADLVIRVPASGLGGVVPALRALGAVRLDVASAQDITREYVDLETRLEVKEQALVRLRQLLANRTAKLSEVLEVEREITRLVSEIEQMKGERRYYDDRVALATIELRVFEPGAQANRRTFTVGKALGQSLEVLSTSLAWLVYLAVFLAPWLLIATGVYKIAQRVRGPSKTP